MKIQELATETMTGSLAPVERLATLPGGRWLMANQNNDGLEYRFAPGTLSGKKYLSADFLLTGDQLAVFAIQFQEGDDGPVFSFSFGLLNDCQARLRMPLEAVNMNTWMYPREGALLKPLVWGQRVDLAKVDRARLILYRKGTQPVTWCMTDLEFMTEEPALLESVLLPAGPLLDELGQSRQRSWPGKTGSAAELVERLELQRVEAESQRWPEHFSRWGGWSKHQWPSTGFFRTENRDGRWWLVDPDGHPFWSAGLDCVGMNIEAAYTGIEKALSWLPERDETYAPAVKEGHTGQRAVNYLVANFIHTFGANWQSYWAEIALSFLHAWGFNTVANWSDWRIASRAGFPYVRPLDDHFPRSLLVYRSFPDVFGPDFAVDAAEYAEQLAETRDDPALIGYFLMNEPTWGFSSELLGEGMLYTTPHCASRRVLADFLHEHYGSDSALAAAWGMEASFDRLADGEWSARLTPKARADMETFSTRMVERYFGTLSDACKKVDPNHLNLGARYYTIPPEWVAKGMRGFDVFSINCYRTEVPADDLRRIHEQLGLPTMIGEWHFGALDAGLPASGIGHVKDQFARGQAYRFYVENAAAMPWCVGVHYFTLYDQSALGRFDGENYNIGFVDVCHRPYDPLIAAALETHKRLYALAAGELDPIRERPEYLPMLFL